MNNFYMKISNGDSFPNYGSSTCSLFIMKDEVVLCKVSDPNRKYSRDLAQGGLKIPCVITFQGNKELVDKVKKLLAVSIKGIKPTDEHNCENSEKR